MASLSVQKVQAGGRTAQELKKPYVSLTNKLSNKSY